MTTPPQGTGYVIQKGDTLYSLARKFHATVAQLEQWNPGIDPSALRIGSTINVAPPVTPPDPLQAKLDAALAENAKLNATVAGMQTSLDAAAVTIAEQAAQIAEMEAEGFGTQPFGRSSFSGRH